MGGLYALHCHRDMLRYIMARISENCGGRRYVAPTTRAQSILSLVTQVMMLR